MNVEELIKQLLPTKNIMQLATSAGNQPWVCNLHYYTDEDLNFYWLSTPERRHSKEISNNPRVAICINVHENTANEDYIIGISAEGTAELLPNIEASILQAYGAKLGTSKSFLGTVQDGTNPHRLYKFTPKSFVIFDTKNFPKDPRQEWRLK